MGWEACVKDNRLDKDIRQEQTILKKTALRKKREYKRWVLNQMTTQRDNNDPRKFWNLLKKISKKRATDVTGIDPHYFSEHFRRLLNLDSSDNNIPPKNNDMGPLDFEISLQEIETASALLKSGKAVGLDNINNEMISSLIDIHPGVILKLFNSILSSSEVVSDWITGAIVPIHKKGSKSDTNN